MRSLLFLSVLAQGGFDGGVQLLGRQLLPAGADVLVGTNQIGSVARASVLTADMAEVSSISWSAPLMLVCMFCATAMIWNGTPLLRTRRSSGMDVPSVK